MSTPFALPGFMSVSSPRLAAEVQARQDGGWEFVTRMPANAPVDRVVRVGVAGAGEFAVLSPETEQLLDRSGVFLKVHCGRDFPEMRALRGDTRFQVEFAGGQVQTQVVRQTQDVRSE